MQYNTLKEKDTWIQGTVLYISFILGIIINSFLNYEPDSFMRVVLLIVLYFCVICLVAFIKMEDRFYLSLKKSDENGS